MIVSSIYAGGRLSGATTSIGQGPPCDCRLMQTIHRIDFSCATSSITGIVVVRGVSGRHSPCHKVGMEETKLEKLARLSGKATSKALDALGKRGFDIRGKTVRADQP